MSFYQFPLCSSRGDVIQLCRTISRMVNSEDRDGGIVEGKWSENNDYRKGTPPYSWTGSVHILRRYYETGTTVRYGQCWVFAGVVTTSKCQNAIDFRLKSRTEI